MASKESKTITVKRDTQQALWELKESPEDTYDEIIRELLEDARGIEGARNE